MKNKKTLLTERDTQVKSIRDHKVKDLSIVQCQRLLVHAHECSHDRHKCLILKAYQEDGVRYFNDDESARLQRLIENGI